MHALREFNFLFESHDSLARKLIRLRVTPGVSRLRWTVRRDEFTLFVPCAVQLL